MNNTSNDSLVLLTVRGTPKPPTTDAARALHNETAGSPAGIAAARALGDLSHKVYTAVKGAPGATAGELLFVDYWLSAEGIGRFFSNPDVQEQGKHMFAERDPVVWMPARGAFGFQLPAPSHKPERWIGIVRGTVASPEATIAGFRQNLSPLLADARRRGQLEHQLFVRIPLPGGPTTPEILGIDVWCDAEGMKEHYAQLRSLDGGFVGKAEMSVWEQTTGFSEW